MGEPLSYPITFQQAVTQVTAAVTTGLTESGSLDGLNDFVECIYIKNEEGTITFANTAYLKFFSAGESPVGRHAKNFLPPSMFSTSRHTDALILSGSEHLECDHTGPASDGRSYLLRTYKCSLRSLKHPGYTILGITRPLRLLKDDQSDPRARLARFTEVYRGLDERDREICRLIAIGLNSSEIGEQLGMTGRNVDLRRKKAFEQLGLTKPVDLVRELVRLQERGYLDLGL